jgi:UDP-N-acetylglucosamine 2-epimerase (non-hydrolysing)
MALRALRAERDFVLCTLHRDFNVDDEKPLSGILNGIHSIREMTGCEILFPIHPRTRKRVSEFDLNDLLGPLRLCDPLGYLDLQSLGCACRFAVTDSGGFQKETYFAGKRAIVVMPDTGWRELVETGWNVLSGPDEVDMLRAAEQVLEDVAFPGGLYGNGCAAERSSIYFWR